MLDALIELLPWLSIFLGTILFLITFTTHKPTKVTRSVTVILVVLLTGMNFAISISGYPYLQKELLEGITGVTIYRIAFLIYLLFYLWLMYVIRRESQETGS